MKTKYSTFQRKRASAWKPHLCLLSGRRPIVFKEAEWGGPLVSSRSFQHIRAARSRLFSKNFRQFWFGLESSPGYVSNRGPSTGLSVTGSVVCGAGSAAARHQGSCRRPCRARCRPGPGPRPWPQSPRPEMYWVLASRPGKIEASFHQRYHVQQSAAQNCSTCPGADKAEKNTPEQYVLSNLMI